jgi:hypothetical protein
MVGWNLCKIEKNICTEDSITGWTTGESSFDSRLGKRDYFLLEGVRTSSYSVATVDC